MPCNIRIPLPRHRILFGGLVAIDLRVVGFACFMLMKGALALIPYVCIGFAISLITGIFFFTGACFANIFSHRE